MTDLSALEADAFITPVSSTCGRCGGPAPKHGAWLLDEPLEAVCAACYLWVDGSYAEALIARGLAHTPPLKAHQPACARFLARRRYALLGSDMGLGKQQPVDTLVLTPSGWQEIGSLAPGSFVIGSDGRPTRVVRVFPQGVKPSYRVTFSDGSSVEAGPDHLWSVDYRIDGKNKWGRVTFTTSQLVDRPTVGRRNFSRTPLYLPMLSGPARFVPSRLPIPPYSMGALLANGGLAHGNKLVYHKKDWPLVAPHVTGLDIGSLLHYGNATHVPVRGLNPLLRAMGLKVLSRHKRIPAKYLLADPEDRAALLQGLMDADGSISKTKNKISYSTYSSGLAVDLVELVEGLGGLASISEYEKFNTYGGKNKRDVEYRVRLRLPGWVLPFRLPRKLVRYNPGSRSRPCRTVESVEYVRDAESVCIQVEAEDALYVTEHCILTHNSRSSLTAVPPGSPVVVLSPKSMAHEWYDEAARWRPDIHPYRGARTAFAWPGPGMIVSVNYEAAELTPPAPGTVFILDEPHLKVKNPGAELTQRIRGLCRWAVTHGGRCWLLTGTPLINTPKDMLDLLDLVLIGHAAFGSKAYYKEVCGAAYSKKRGQKEAGKIENLPELRRRLGKVVIRHLKKDLPDEEKLPPKHVRVVPVEISPEDAQVIHEHVRRLVAARRTNEEVLQGKIASPRERGLTAEQKEYRKGVWQAHFNLILANLTDPDEKEIVEAIETALEHQGELPGFEELAEVRSALATAKIRAAGELAARFEAQGEPCVFFACHRMPIDALGKREGWAVVTGSETAKKRKEAKDAFQRGELKGLGVMVRAGGTGLTLTRSNNEVFVDRDWTSVANEQAEGRLDRISQTREVTVWKLIANHAVDRHVERICERKAQLIAAILGEPLVDGDEVWREERERVLAWRRT